MSICKHEELIMRPNQTVEGAAFPVFLYVCKVCDATIAVSELAYHQSKFDEVRQKLARLDQRVSKLDGGT